MLETCPTKSSVYYGFMEQFWKQVYSEAIWPDGNFNDYYDEHPDDFLTPYAVTDAGEDIAESFSEFIFNDLPTNQSLIKNQKIDYFWQFSEFVELRKEIRSNFGE